MKGQREIEERARARGRSRRDFLTASLAAGGAILVPSAAARLEAAFGQLGSSAPDPFAAGRFAGTLTLYGAGAADNMLGTLMGAGLDARLFTDLSGLTPDTLITPNERFYIRTAYPDRLGSPSQWTIALGGLVEQPMTITLDEMLPMAREHGPLVMECAGNNNPANFGLMSAARWAGVPMSIVLSRMRLLPRATRVLVSGFDGHSEPSRTSTPGASWVFSLEQLDRAGAFLATRMNGVPLPKDHGFPVRLVVPRWYGCASVKWVNEITLVDDSAAATPHMREFAPRTFQKGRPDLARDFKPASMDHAAMPVRVEKWIVDGKVVYRVIGIMWGGDTITTALVVRFNPNERFVPVDTCPRPLTTDMWTLWSHAWRPASPGRYRIVLKIDDPAIRTERLDSFFYTREVSIDEV